MCILVSACKVTKKNLNNLNFTYKKQIKCIFLQKNAYFYITFAIKLV